MQSHPSLINFTTPTGFSDSATPPLISPQIKKSSSPFLIKHSVLQHGNQMQVALHTLSAPGSVSAVAPAIACWVGVTCSGVSLQNLAVCLSSLHFEVLGAVEAGFLLLRFLKRVLALHLRFYSLFFPGVLTFLAWLFLCDVCPTAAMPSAYNL